MSKPVVLITGALAGIGKATAIAFAHLGAQIVVSGRKDDLGTSLVQELTALGSDALYVRADVRFEHDVEALVAATVKRFGRLDIAVNNAGVEGDMGPLVDQTPEQYTKTFETNVLGVLMSMKHEFRVMSKQGSGSIVNLSSTMGSRGAANASLYVGSKHAVEGITKSAALEGAPLGIRVNAVAPGPVQTDLLDRFVSSPERREAMQQGVPMKRFGLAQEIAEAIIFVSSDKASYLTGQIINVNGGKTAS